MSRGRPRGRGQARGAAPASISRESFLESEVMYASDDYQIENVVLAQVLQSSVDTQCLKIW